MEWSAFLNAITGLLQLALVVLVARHLLGFVRPFPWLAALMTYFALRGTARLYDAFFVAGQEAIELATDAVLVIVLVLLALSMRRTVTGLKLAIEAAELRQREYERALADYRALARHRLANPLTSILGGLKTLREMPELDPATRLDLLEGMEQAAHELAAVSLDPVADAPEESTLDPRPKL